MKTGDSVIEIKTGKEYIVFDECETEICILQWFAYAERPFERQLKIWQDKSKFEISR